jgi:hypothetical protein
VIAMLVSFVVDVFRSVWDVVSDNSLWFALCFLIGYDLWRFVRASLVRR